MRPSVIANSRLSLEASEFVRERAPEAFDRFHTAVFRAYFEQDRNIGDIEVLVALAGEEGIDGAALREALTERRHVLAVDERIQWAGERGISSTPFFLFAGDRLYGFPGAQEYPVFESVMQRIGIARHDGAGGTPAP